MPRISRLPRCAGTCWYRRMPSPNKAAEASEVCDTECRLARTQRERGLRGVRGACWQQRSMYRTQYRPPTEPRLLDERRHRSARHFSVLKCPMGLRKRK
jgi:hypothetical protein